MFLFLPPACWPSRARLQVQADVLRADQLGTYGGELMERRDELGQRMVQLQGGPAMAENRQLGLRLQLTPASA
ncbi:hypothetical protein C1170_16590 [Stutzerimonas frequens]|uniref:Uncharacterized protein n=1 Tax=Stutzerimonas frequens TaxID=2968969 RepID=A0ABX6Y0W7_9GAMM|nr:hypothetical protein [Stutzerimonas frequens]MCQ4304340.1 hypothetical protein [Stutzerimonas frequens]PNF50013.1 hypothetical protein C1170_16590 [Stutzerimonas frequens]QPT19916.1 hypothetical protein I6G34_11800 [Stutzerimonas frequens]